MDYVNPAPDHVNLTQLYKEATVDPVYETPGPIQLVSRTGVARSLWGAIIRSLNGRLRGHPHDWPDEPGEGRSILDFGCYDGTKLNYWYQRGWQVAGIDLNDQAIEIARRRFPDGRFWAGDLLELDVEEHFDFIRIDNVVEHLLDPSAYLRTLANLLKSCGQLRVFVPNGTALSAKLFGPYSAVYWMPFHLNLFTPITLGRLLNQAGLKNVACTTYTPIGSWTWTQRQLLLKPGFNRRFPTFLDKMIRRVGILNYTGETLAQWVGLGEELIATCKAYDA